MIKGTIFLRDMAHCPTIAELRGRFFKPPYPADTIVEASSLYSREALLAIEAIAVANDAVERGKSSLRSTYVCSTGGCMVVVVFRARLRSGVGKDYQETDAGVRLV